MFGIIAVSKYCTLKEVLDIAFPKGGGVGTTDMTSRRGVTYILPGLLRNTDQKIVLLRQDLSHISTPQIYHIRYFYIET